MKKVTVKEKTVLLSKLSISIKDIDIPNIDIAQIITIDPRFFGVFLKKSQ